MSSASKQLINLFWNNNVFQMLLKCPGQYGLGENWWGMGDEMDVRSHERLFIMLSGRLGQMCDESWSAILNESLGGQYG